MNREPYDAAVAEQETRHQTVGSPHYLPCWKAGTAFILVPVSCAVVMSSTSTVADVLRSSRREALFVAVVWVLACGYTVGYSALFGYGQTSTPPLVNGIPSWVLWGILAPWGVTSAVTCWFAFFGMKDQDLGEQMAPPTGEGTRDE